jgi:hypothetical protein
MVLVTAFNAAVTGALSAKITSGASPIISTA